MTLREGPQALWIAGSGGGRTVMLAVARLLLPVPSFAWDVKASLPEYRVFGL